MEVIRSVARMQNLTHRLHEDRKRIGLAPTRGQLHDGHLALVRKTQQLADVTIVALAAEAVGSSSGGDDKQQPAVLTQDVELLAPLQVDYVFAPKREELSHSDSCTQVVVRGIRERLFGSVRPGYYTETSTLLVIMLNITRPDIVGLGQKDPQLVAIAKHLIADLHFPCQLIVVPTVREQDGVAASRWLSKMTTKQRGAATLIYKALERAQVLYGAGERDAANLINAMREVLEPEPLIHTDYLGIADQETLEPLANIDETPACVAIAATIGDTQLLDSIILNE